MKRLNIRKMKVIVGFVCAISIIMSSFTIAEAAENEKKALKIERYYASKDDGQYFDYFIAPDPVAEGYNGLYITELSPNYGKYLEVPDTLSGVVISDVYLMDLDKTEEVKLGDNVVNFSCVYPEKNLDGTLGKYADAFSKRKWFYSEAEYKQSEETAKNAKPQNRIKKITVGKNFEVDSILGDWVRMYHFYDILKDMYNYSTFWKLSNYTNLEQVILPENFENFRVESGAVYSMNYKKLLWVFPKVKKEMISFTINDKCTSIKSTGYAWGRLPEWEKLKTIKFGKNFKTVSSFDFSRCYSLEKVKFNKKLKEIEPDAFCMCNNLREVILPAGLKVVGFKAFAGCNKIKRFVVKGKNTKLDRAAVEKSVVIIGKKGSQAQKYAKKNGNKFKVLK